MKAPKQKWPRADAVRVARELVDAIQPHCERLVVAGSLRRRKKTVGDVEILYISSVEVRPARGDLFRTEHVNVAEEAIQRLEHSGVIARRLNKRGNQTYGCKNKLMTHVSSGIPVDLFAATDDVWWNYLVCRTGGAQNNINIAQAAKAIGWTWNPYGVGFSRPGDVRQVNSERDVYEFVGLEYLEPWERQ